MPRHRIEPHVASIPPGAPFLPTLVDALLNGQLIEGSSPGDDPLALADVTIWVPTRRAARELATEFVSRLESEVALLPAIHALGDVDEDDLHFDEPGVPSLPNLAVPVGGLERQIVLAQLIAKWADALKPAQRDLYDGADIIMPASFADAAWFAQDLARLMDMVATEEVDWAALDSLIPEDFEHWWQITLEFLKIATLMWPQELEERGKIDGATLRADRLRRQADVYRNSGSKGPVIAAGSTGSIPATADLLDTIARMDTGIVVLPGLDRDITDEVWQKIDLPDNERDDSGTAPGHPQYGLKRLVDHFGLSREQVRHLGGIADASAGSARVRERLVSAALLPSHATGSWRTVRDDLTDLQRSDALASVTLIEAANERSEALAIALALRETLEVPTNTAALVTPDRNLARRVAVELRRFGLDVDDSAGQPLSNRPHGTFVRLILQVAFKDADPVALVSLLKHPLTRFGEEPRAIGHAANMLELVALRGAIVPIGRGDFAEAVELAVEKYAAPKARIPAAVQRLDEDDWEAARNLATQLDTVFKPNADTEDRLLSDLVRETVLLIEACGKEEGGDLTALYDGEDGKALSAFLGELLDIADDLNISPREWPEIFDAFLGSKVVRSTGGTHPRLSILGPLEARLQTFDRVVLGGLNEKTWPAASRNDPFLSRPMKASLGLPPPERRTGLAAHDFQMMLGMSDVVITRSARVDNAPTIASRWVQRLMMIAGDETVAAMRSRGDRILAWTAQIDHPTQPQSAIPQPAPRPPVPARPTGLSITDIETWIRDPYAIYAKHVLKLTPLDPLIREADARERGVLYHAIFEEFVRDHLSAVGAVALDILTKIADRHFAASALPPETAALWRPRFDTICRGFLDWHEERLGRSAESRVELSASRTIEPYGFRLRGRADRVDVMSDGNLSIIDYKTGGVPTKEAVKSLVAPQLPLEAALANQGAFEGIDGTKATELIYLALRPTEKLAETRFDAGDLPEKAWDELRDMIAEFSKPETPYISKARIPKDQEREGDYDHLARVREWSLADDGSST